MTTTDRDGITAAMYLRQSLDRDGRELAITRQREDLEKLCADRGWRPIEYADNDISASNGKRRPAYQQMLADIESGRVQAVAVWHMDRLHRQPMELEHFMDLADRCKLKLATVTGEVDLSTDNGRLVARITGAVARAEVERKSARQKRAALQRAESGKVWSPCRVFGYTTAQSDGTGMEPVEAEAEVLRQLYAGVLAGRSMQGLARELNAKVVKTSRGGTWKATTLREVLLSPRYAGLRAYRGEVVGKGDWPAIVSEDVWRGAVAVLTDPARVRRPHNGYGRKYLLTGLIHCGVCDSKMGSTTHTQTKHPIYVCRSCQKASRSIEKVDDYVMRLVAERLSRPDAVELLVARERQGMAQLQDEANALRARQDELAVAFAEGTINASQLRSGTASLETQLKAIESNMFDANKSRIFEGVIGAADVRAALDGLSLDRRRAVIGTLLTLRVLPGQPSRGALRTDLLPVQWLS